MRRIIQVVVVLAMLLVGFGSVALATAGQGDVQRADVGRGTHANAGTIRFDAGHQTVVYTATFAPGSTSGWHRHPGAVIVVVKSGTLTTYGLSHPPCVGQDIPAGQTYFEPDASTARWPHFVRNRGTVPTEIAVIAFNVPGGGPPRVEADAPRECVNPA
jgi:hypothetical protein